MDMVYKSMEPPPVAFRFGEYSRRGVYMLRVYSIGFGE